MADKFNQNASSPVYNSSVLGEILAECNEKDQDMQKRPYRSPIESLLYPAMSSRTDARISSLPTQSSFN